MQIFVVKRINITKIILIYLLIIMCESEILIRNSQNKCFEFNYSVHFRTTNKHKHAIVLHPKLMKSAMVRSVILSLW